MSNKVTTRSNTNQATTTSSRRKEVQFSGSSLPVLEDEDSFIKRPRSHSNPAKKVESFYAVRDKLRESSTPKFSLDPRIKYKPDIRPPKAGSEASLRRSSSSKSNSSVKSTSSVKSIPVSKTSSSVKSFPVYKSSTSSKSSSAKPSTSNKTTSGVTSSRHIASQTQHSLEEIEASSTNTSSLVSQLKALSSGIMNIQPEAGSKKYIPIESTPPEELNKSKQKSEHGFSSKSNAISSSGTFSPSLISGKVEKSGEKKANNSDDEEEVLTNGQVTTRQPHSSSVPGSSHVTSKVPQSLNGILSGSSQLTTEEAQPLLLPANRVVSTGVCKWFQCCPVATPNASKSSTVLVEPDY